MVSPTDPQKDAELVVDGETGRTLFARNADEPRHPASLTKMMTLYLLFEQLKSGQMTLATPLTVSEHAATQAPTKLHLRAGSTIPVDTAIKAAVILSANDVAVAIAEAIGGSEGHFADMMTAKARALGMTHTYFHNASGLPDDLQITSAGDLAILARHLAYDFPQYFHYFSAYSFNFRGYTILTHDNLIGRYYGADGIKTGYTGASGFNLVSSVVRNGVHIIGVVMGGRSAHRRDQEMMRLLDTTFVAINQNPRMVARANVPWQAIADNVGAGPVIAGFPLGGAGMSAPSSPSYPPAAQPQAVASNGFEDEDAAESRPDPEDVAPSTTPSPNAMPSPRIAVASLGLRNTSATAATPPAPAAKPLLTDAIRQVVVTVSPTPRPTPDVSVSTGAIVPSVVPHPIPRPLLTLAAYEPASRPTAASGSGDAEPGHGAPGGAPSSAVPSPGHDWTIQIGAYGDVASAKAELANYAEHSLDVLGQTTRIVAPFQSTEGQTLYRARFGPFDEREARAVCQRLTARGQTCFAALASR
jgi:D-alanyl-D-alanine carboxypeptidase